MRSKSLCSTKIQVLLVLTTCHLHYCTALWSMPTHPDFMPSVTTLSTVGLSISCTPTTSGHAATSSTLPDPSPIFFIPTSLRGRPHLTMAKTTSTDTAAHDKKSRPGQSTAYRTVYPVLSAPPSNFLSFINRRLCGHSAAIRCQSC